MSEKPPAPDPAEDFASQALLGEFWYFLKTNKKWWLTPIILVLLLLGVLILLGGTPLAPFVFRLF